MEVGITDDKNEAIIMASVFEKATGRTYSLAQMTCNPLKFKIVIEVGGDQYDFGSFMDFNDAKRFMDTKINNLIWGVY